MKHIITLASFVLFSSWQAFGQQSLGLNQAFQHAEEQTKVMLREIEAATDTIEPSLVSPKTLTTTGKLKLITSKDWTSGFFPGNLWFLYEHTQDPYWLAQAQAFSEKVRAEQFDTGTHDVGFKIYGSFGAGYRLTQEADYREVIIRTAKSLATRFDAKVGCIRSWDHSTNLYRYPVIIDNMMNLELLFAATRLTGDSSYYKIAVAHANTTLKNHFRPDYSSWHVVDYDTATGNVIKKVTAQGYSNSSAWARGQAWALYGYTMCYRETKNPVYLRHAENITDYILNHPNLPADGVPYWDFNAPLIPDEPRDASAGAIIASALYELSTYSQQSEEIYNWADKILTNLATQYESPVGKNRGFILLHSTGTKPRNIEVDVPLIYADYYYLEALTRRKQTNFAPQIAPIGTKTVTVGNALNFTVAATDSNSNQSKIFSLVNAPSGAQINSESGNFTWTPTKAGTYSFLVRVTDNGSPVLSTERSLTVTVNPIKYYSLKIVNAGGGVVNRSPNQTTYAEGTKVQLEAVPAAGYQFEKWSGDITGTNASLVVTMDGNKQITAQFSLIPPQIWSVNVINADTDQVIYKLLDGDVINLANLETKRLSIAATINPVSTKSVVFELTGEYSRKQTESGNPYVLFGDTKGNINPWTPPVGAYSLKITPYAASAGEGTAGKSQTINFSVVNSNISNKQQRLATDLKNKENAASNSLVYPNPTTDGKIKVQLPSTFQGKIQYQLTSLIGAKLVEGTRDLSGNVNSLAFDFSKQMAAAGIYYLNVQSVSGKKIIKIVRH